LYLFIVGLKKKIVAASKQKDCAKLSKWTKSLTNHMYWVAASTPDGNGEVMLAKWESVDNHIHNVHEGHGHLFPTCAHGQLEGDDQKKKWLKPGNYNICIAKYNHLHCNQCCEE
jgi:solute carrier family 8 (sodium/calcium exchanger)